MFRSRADWAVTVAWLVLIVVFALSYDRVSPWLQDAALAMIGSMPLVLVLLAVPRISERRPRVLLITVIFGGLALAVIAVIVPLSLQTFLSPAVELPMPVVEEPDPTLGEYRPTPPDVVEAMLELARVSAHDVVYDLGSGDGRIVVAAARRYGARAVGIDLDPARVEESRQNVREAGVEDLVEIREGDAFRVPDIERASVVTLDVSQPAMHELRPILQERLKVGSRIVARESYMENWEPSGGRFVWTDGAAHHVYSWEVEESHKSAGEATAD